jgi:acyl carrier protein
VNVLERLQAILRDLVDSDQVVITDETRADDVEGWDSVVQINLMFAVEQEFSVQFSNTSVFQFQNVGELRRWIEASMTPVIGRG